jgi:formylglycine-generating enzyme required for sulfatase activity
LALIATATIGGCFVSFDGYQLSNNAGDAGAAALGGRANQSPGGAAGSTTTLNGGDAGATANGGTGEMGAAPDGGAGNASGGAANGGAAGNAGGDSGGAAHGGAGTAGASGAPNGGVGGNAGGAANGGAGGNAGGAGGSGAVMHCPPGTTNRASQEVPLPGGGFYCIDHAEVRNVDYKAFVDAQANTAGQSTACAFNASYQPDVAGQCDQYDPTNKPDLPIACVDWCDAAAFCKWDGKHLCGKLGGGSNAPADFADPSKSAWYRACSHAGDDDFPYGNSYSGDKCVGLDNTAVHPLATPFTSCVGGYDGLYDMSGNVAEWEDSCSGSAGAADLCLDRGGSYLDTNVSVGAAPSLQCNSNVHGSPKMATKARSTRSPEIGFRCCSEAVPGPP